MTALQIDGGAPVRVTPFPTWPSLGAEEADAAYECITRNELWQNAGPDVERFETALAVWHELPHVVALNSGTSALHLTLLALHIGPGDEVLVPAWTFVGCAAAVLYCGATPVFVDVDLDSYCMEPEDAMAKVTERTKAVLAVHLNGHPAPLDQLLAVAAGAGAHLIEDAAQAHGARYRGRPVGSFGIATCLSFWHDKVITTAGEGGAVLTPDPDVADRIRLLRHHGEAPHGHLRAHVERGYNYRLTAVQAAVGLVQARKLPGFVAARRRNADYLSQRLAQVDGLHTPTTAAHCEPVPWRFVCRVDPRKVSLSIEEVVARLNAEGVPAQRRYPISLPDQPLFRSDEDARCPNAALCASSTFTLPVHPAVSFEDLDDCVRAVHKVFGSG